MKIKISTLLMEGGVSYNKQRLHKADYFRELLATNPHIDEGLRALLRQCRELVVRLGKTENALIRSLRNDRFLAERVERFMGIPAIGPITALTWALEIGEVQRFPSIKKASHVVPQILTASAQPTETIELSRKVSGSYNHPSGLTGGPCLTKTYHGSLTGHAASSTNMDDTRLSGHTSGSLSASLTRFTNSPRYILPE